MPKPDTLSSARDDLLESFGTSPKDVYESDVQEDAEPAEEPQEEEVEPEPQEVAEPEGETAEADSDTEEEEPEEYSAEDLVAMANKAFSEEPEPEKQEEYQTRSELDRLKQEVQTLRSILGERVASSEQDLRQPAKEEESEGVPDWKSPEVIRMVANQMGLDEEEAARIVPLFGTMAEYVAQEKFGKEVTTLKERLKQEEEVKNREREMQGYWNNLSTALQYAARRGGIEEAIVKDFLTNKGGSLLTRHLQKFPYKLQSPEGVVDAVVSVARGVQLMDAERRAPKGEQSENAGPIVGSKDEVMGALKKQRNKTSTPKPTEDEEFLDAVMNAGVGAKGKLPKGFFG